jgi:benzoyl-CoA reductase/2-hydroxyglutaryl-CoA dehydratase subunit BcrC/BadD/HgdB
METTRSALVAFTCSYLPVPLIYAAGFAPYRVLPQAGGVEQAGTLLHENLCPHIKRVLDRAVNGDVPPLAGAVFVNSCDAMRRLHDAWRTVRPSDRTIVVDLPPNRSEATTAHFVDELRKLAAALAEWSGRALNEPALRAAVDQWNELCAPFATLRSRAAAGRLAGGRGRLQTLYNVAATTPPEQARRTIAAALAEPEAAGGAAGAPIFLTGNVLADPDAFALFDECGALLVDEDLCTGARMFEALRLDGRGGWATQVARAMLNRTPCARTYDDAEPLGFAADLTRRAKASGARGVVLHVVKFCDPYLARIPRLRETLREAGLPLLVLEGDCTLGALGQFKTRLEAFVEMLG